MSIRPHRLQTALAALVACLGAAGGVAADPPGKPAVPGLTKGAPEEAPDGNTLIRPSLIAERTALVPGAENWIAVRLDIAPGWHTYWRNSGESGLPPAFTFQAPDWVRIGDPVWPTPRRYALPSGGVDYIYENTALILFPVRIDDTDREIRTDLEITATVEWLVCQEACLPGEATVTLNIPVNRTSEPSRPEAPLFALAKARVPEPAAANPNIAARFVGDTLTVTAPGSAEIEFFPYESRSLARPADPLAQGVSQTGTLRVTYTRVPTDRPTIDGVLRVLDAAGAERFFDIRVPVEPPAAP